ncbi:unnamed protein product [Polarella glacialis]|nr:unnamed protein product [Polarella glacialis]
MLLAPGVATTIQHAWDSGPLLHEVQLTCPAAGQELLAKFWPQEGSVEILGFTAGWLLGAEGGVVMVTGGAGYIGSHMTLKLFEAGFDVLIVDNLSRGHLPVVRVLQAEACRLKRRMGFANVDLGRREMVNALLLATKPDFVFHFAGNAYVSESMREPLLYFRNVTENTLILMDAMEQAGSTNIIYSSSCATYGIPDQHHLPITEEVPQKPVSAYGKSKLMAEEMLLQWASSRPAVCVTILRYFNVFGADPLGRVGELPNVFGDHQDTRLSGALLDAVMGFSPAVKVYGTDYPTQDGTAERDYIHVWDLVDAHLRALQHSSKSCGPGNQSQILNLGLGKSVSVLTMIAAARALPGAKGFAVQYLPRRPGDPPRIWTAASKARSTLGWKPAFQDLTASLLTSLEFRRKNLAFFASPASAKKSTPIAAGAAQHQQQQKQQQQQQKQQQQQQHAQQLYGAPKWHPSKIPNASFDSDPWVVNRFSRPEASPRMCMQCIMIPGILTGSSYLRGTFVLQREYARRHGYDLYTLVSRLNETRPPSWLKVKSTQALIASGTTGCDYIFWMDGDAVIMNMSFKLESIIGYQGRPDTDLVISGDTLLVNVAQSLWKFTPFVYQLLEDIWNMGDIQLWETGALSSIIGGCKPSDDRGKKKKCYDVADRGWRDHDFGEKVVKLANATRLDEVIVNKSLKEHIQWVPKRLFNSYPLGLFWGYYSEKEPDFIVHLVAGGKAQMSKWQDISMRRHNITMPPDLMPPKKAR